MKNSFKNMALFALFTLIAFGFVCAFVYCMVTKQFVFAACVAIVGVVAFPILKKQYDKFIDL